MKLNDQSQIENQETNVEINNGQYDYDPELARKIIEHIPRYTWPAVLDACVANIVDELPIDVLTAMAEMYLTDYYIEHPGEIIPDMLRLKGAESTVYILDSLQLDKLPEPARKRAQDQAQLNQPTDTSPSSLDPE